MNHLTSDELIDAMEGVLDAARQCHVESCDPCRRELAALSGVLREARSVDVPEPSPLFWPHFSERVRAAVETEAVPQSRWPQWLRWPVLAPVGALALIVLVVNLSGLKPVEWSTVNGSPHQSPVSQAVNDRSAGEASMVTDSWAMVADLVGEMDWDTASAAGLFVEPGAAEQAVLDLSPAEQRELTRLLRAELQRAKS